MLFGFALGVRALVWALVGTRPAGDTASYLAACRGLIQDPSGLLSDTVGWEYLGFLVPLCTATLGGTVPDAWIIVQALASALVPVLLVALGGALGNRGAGWLAGIAYAILPEALQWDLYVLSDSWFTLVLTATIWLLVRPRPTPKWAAPVALVVLAVTRPFGVPLVAGILLLHAFRGTVPRAGLGKRSALAVVVALPLAQQLLSRRQGWSESLFPRLWQEGIVVYDDATLVLPSDAHASSALGYLLAEPLHFLMLAVTKAALLFTPVWPRFSLFHNLLGVVTLGPIILLGLWGLFRAVRAREPAGYIAMAVVTVTTGVVALTFIDYDWRYRLPLLPLLTLFAALVVFPAPAQAWPRVGGWASRPLQRIGVPDRHLTALQGVATASTWAEVEETAVPSYVHWNPFIRWLFGRRVEVALRMVGNTPRRVLDVGSGGGLLVAAALSQGHKITGVDRDTRPAVAAGLGDYVQAGDANQLPLEEVDVLVAMDILEHLTDLGPFMDGARRSLAPGGYLVLSGPSESLLYRLGRRLAGYDGHYHERNIQDILAAFQATGWTVEQKQGLPRSVGLFRLAVLHPPERV